MSGQYQVTVHLKDSGTLKKLEQLQKGSPTGGVSQASGGSGGIFAKLQQLGAGQLLKLTGISLGVGSVVALLTKSSGQLQATFKLLETGMVMVFRPFGDFIGLALRPLALMMIAFAIPFYRAATPVFRNYATLLGKAFAGKGEPQAPGGVLRDINPSAESAAELTIPGYTGIKELIDMSGIDTALKAEPGMLWASFLTVSNDISQTLSNVPSMIWTQFETLSTRLGQWLTNIPQIISSDFLNFTNNISNSLAGIPNTLLDVFTGLASSLGAALAGVPGMILEAIQNALRSVLPGVENFGSGADRPRGFAQYQATRTAAIADTVSE